LLLRLSKGSLHPLVSRENYAIHEQHAINFAPVFSGIDEKKYRCRIAGVIAFGLPGFALGLRPRPHLKLERLNLSIKNKVLDFSHGVEIQHPAGVVKLFVQKTPWSR
jgi:hypothetical protein